MLNRTAIVITGMLASLLLAYHMASAEESKSSEKDTQEYKQALARIKSSEETFTPGPTNDLAKWEKLADEIQGEWSQRNKEYFARLMLAICPPLTEGQFNDPRQYELARKYALAALEDPDAIPTLLECRLSGQLNSLLGGAKAPSGEIFAKRRTKDVELRLHAWKRMIDSIDQKWDPNEKLKTPSVVASEVGLSNYIEPEEIKDAALRAKYEAALMENQAKIERNSEQAALRDSLKSFQLGAKLYLVHAYSKPPFDSDELKGFLDRYIADATTRAQILDQVTKNIESQKASNK